MFGQQQNSYLDDGLWNFWNYFALNLICRDRIQYFVSKNLFSLT